MPTSNPRVNVTLAPAMAARLKRISELTGNSQSALIATLLDTQAEVFDRLILVLEAADKAQRQARETLEGGKLTGQLREAQVKIERQLGLALEEFDTATGNLLKDVEGVQRRAAGRSASAPSRRPATPPSNRGVRSTGKTPKKSTRTRG